MTAYRRANIEGGTYFFTVNCIQRRGNHLLVENIELLRGIVRKVKTRHPFEIDAMVVLPEHIHCIWTLPPGDADAGMRWGLIKAGFSRAIAGCEPRSESRIKRRERGIWQRRYWEHLIRNEEDFTRHVDYIHWNPVKHGWVERVRDWPFSSFHRYVHRGIYPEDWASTPAATINAGEAI